MMDILTVKIHVKIKEGDKVSMKQTSINPLLIVLGTIIVQIGLGTIYTWSLFNQPLVSKFGWNLNSVAITFSTNKLFFIIFNLVCSKVAAKIRTS